MRPIPDVKLTVVSPFSRATYSGMLPGTLAGLYQPDEMEIDLYRFAESCGARLVVAEAIGLEPEIRRVLFRDRPPLRYDVASIGIGSVPGQREVWQSSPHVLSIKPMATFWQRFAALVERALNTSGRDRLLRIAVIGAGAGGTEVALGLDGNLRARNVAAEIRLVDAHAEILRGYSCGAIRRTRDELSQRGIVTLLGKRVEKVTSSAANGTASLLFDDATEIAADIIVWATAASPPDVLANYRLPKSDDGFLAVRPTLQTTADFPVFAVGDTATIVGTDIPKAGVYAVREGPILWQNLQRIFSGGELVPYQPQRGFLSLLSTGDGRAIMDFKGFSAHASWAWKLKDHIDRKFMRMYQDYRPRMTGGGETSHITVDPRRPVTMRCAGCGGKVGADVLSAALERLPIPDDRRATVGLKQPDDAVVLDRQMAPVDVLSVDFFTAFLDDPYLVGRVAALNAQSDLWAMGAEPLGAMAIVTLPEGAPTQQTELLYQLLAGGVRELSDAGATLWGGHTIAGPELTVGYSVAGKLDGQPPLIKGGLQPGDLLILTKPLGTATLLAGHRLCRTKAAWMDAMIAAMLQSNRVAARIARQFEVISATDITGFGLAGHLFEMLDASRVSARLLLSAIPLLNGFAELSAAGVRSSLDPMNRRTESRLRAETDLRSSPAYHALFDPQTAGGLLLAVSDRHAQSVVRELQAAGIAAAAIVGEVTAADGECSLEILNDKSPSLAH